MNLIVNWVSDNVSYDSFEKIIHGFSQSLKLVRLDRGVTGGSAVLLVAPSEEASFDLIMAELKKVDPQVSITFFEAKTNY